MNKAALIYAATLISLLALSACGGGSDAPGASGQASEVSGAETVFDNATDDTRLAPVPGIDEGATEAVERVEIGGLTYLPVSLGDSVETLTRSQEYVVVARVTSVAVGYPLAESLVEHLIPKTPLPPEHPKANVAPDPDGKIGPVGSRYRLEVLEVIDAPDLAVGDSFSITAWGGTIDGVRYEDAGDPLLEVGTSYFMFLQKPGSETFTSLPFGRFEISRDGRLQRVTDHFDILGAVSELKGLPLNEAIARVDSVLQDIASR